MLLGKGCPRERLEDVSVQVWRLLPDTLLGRRCSDRWLEVFGYPAPFVEIIFFQARPLLHVQHPLTTTTSTSNHSLTPSHTISNVRMRWRSARQWPAALMFPSICLCKFALRRLHCWWLAKFSIRFVHTGTSAFASPDVVFHTPLVRKGENREQRRECYSRLVSKLQSDNSLASLLAKLTSSCSCVRGPLSKSEYISINCIEKLADRGQHVEWVW